MPCFKGLAVSIHTPNGPLPEYSIQKQGRQSRISSYIPVPPPKFTPGSDRPEQSTFAISITLLTPGSSVPYSRPAPTEDDPYPVHKIVGGLPGYGVERGKYASGVGPYIPITSSPNETVAAYIHFDGRHKEEVATLLRRGVETWVNSRWVGVSEAEGGGLAEREFLFREVGLERWLNGLDLTGETKDVAARIERRKAKLEKKRRKKLLGRGSEDEDEDDKDKDKTVSRARQLERNGVLRYGGDQSAPVEGVPLDGDLSSTDSDSEDEMPDPEATGQIKVSLFRVMASGEIKRGEYSPSFDAHDDDDDEGIQESRNGNDPGVDHTTTFAKPKTLDPKSISTQTVTGIDDPTTPYATFTFFYRGERQLQKMGILPRSNSPEAKPTTKRKPRQVDLSALGPLKSDKGTVGFAGYRDPANKAKSSGLNGTKRRDNDEMDSDDEGPIATVTTDKGKKAATEDEELGAMEDETTLDPDEMKRRGELAEGVEKMQLKRQRSFDPSQTKSAKGSPETKAEVLPASIENATLSPTLPPSTAAGLPSLTSTRLGDSDGLGNIGSPFKKQRASVSAMEPRKLFPTSGLLQSSNTGPLATSASTSFPHNPDTVFGSSLSPVAGPTSIPPKLASTGASTAREEATNNAAAPGLPPPLASTLTSVPDKTGVDVKADAHQPTFGRESMIAAPEKKVDIDGDEEL